MFSLNVIIGVFYADVHAADIKNMHMRLMIGLKSDKCDRRAWRVLRDPKKQVKKNRQQNPRDQRDHVTHVTYPTTHVRNVTDM